MPQGPLTVYVAQNAGKTAKPLNLDANGNLLTAPGTPAGLLALQTTQALVAQSLKTAAGVLVAYANLTTTYLGGLTSTQQLNLTTEMGAFYDTNIGNLGPLTTTQVTALASTYLVALAPQTVDARQLGIALKNGLVFLPGTGQSALVEWQ